jgi:hypothetical protein
MRIGRFIIVTEAFPRFNYNDFVDVSGILDRRLTDSGQPQIWLMYPDIQFVEDVKKFDRVGIQGLFSLLFRLRRRVELNFSNLLTEPQTSLLAGVVLSARRRMPEEFFQALRRTGTDNACGGSFRLQCYRSWWGIGGIACAVRF